VIRDPEEKKVKSRDHIDNPFSKSPNQLIQF